MLDKYRRPLRFAYGKLGRRYPRVALAVQFQLSHLVVAGGTGLLALYVRLDATDFLWVLLVSQALVLVENVLALHLVFSLLKPADRWLRGERNERTALEAWRVLAGLPIDFIHHRRALAVVFNIVPISIFIKYQVDGIGWEGVPILVAGAAIVLLYGVFLRFFAMEIIVRPVLEEIAGDLPDTVELPPATVSLRTRLLVALPAINIISGVVVSGLANWGHPSISHLGIGVLAALAVTFTISFEMTVLLARSILSPLADLRRATEAVQRGDLSVRVPVVSSDEPGALAVSFNRMVRGLEERERLREAFGTYVDPELADRVLREGLDIGGEEVEVSILFLDIRGFTAFAERSAAHEVVTQLNDLFGRVVPVVVSHRGHANKFIGDGLMAVFGAPDRQADHADCAVAAALEIADLVERTYGDRLRIGIGVNSGPVVAGSIGGGGRLEFTVIGDAVNTAARVEAATRETGDTVLITEATRCLLTRDHGSLEERPPVELKGKTEDVRLHAALAAGAAESVGAPETRARTV